MAKEWRGGGGITEVCAANPDSARAGGAFWPPLAKGEALVTGDLRDLTRTARWASR